MVPPSGREAQARLDAGRVGRGTGDPRHGRAGRLSLEGAALAAGALALGFAALLAADTILTERLDSAWPMHL
jgi:hypothetical protein